MPDIELSFEDFDRVYADLPPAALINRFFEQNPFQGKKKAAIGRPPAEVVGAYGNGPLRKFYSEPGLFEDALFFVSGDTLYRRDVDGTTYAITGVIYGSGEVTMAGAKGLDYQRLFIADGNRLQFYGGGTQASGVLGFGAGTDVADGDTVEINGTYYEFETPVSGVVGAPTDAGTQANPFKIAIAGTYALSFANLVAAISFTGGTNGTKYSATLAGQNTEVTAALNSAQDEVTITSVTDTAAGNSYTFTVSPSGTNLTATGSGTLAGGNNHGLSGIEIPDGLPPTQVAVLKSFALVAIGRTDRFYFVRPGEVTINALDFATAEAYPDNIVSLQVLQDTAWFIGQKSTEIWYPTGDVDLPFSPVVGRVYDRGALPGTVVNIKGTLYLVDQDYMVYAIGGGPKRVSNHGIEEVIRKVIASET